MDPKNSSLWPDLCSSAVDRSGVQHAYVSFLCVAIKQQFQKIKPFNLLHETTVDVNKNDLNAGKIKNQPELAISNASKLRFDRYLYHNSKQFQRFILKKICRAFIFIQKRRKHANFQASSFDFARPPVRPFPIGGSKLSAFCSKAAFLL